MTCVVTPNAKQPRAVTPSDLCPASFHTSGVHLGFLQPSCKLSCKLSQVRRVLDVMRGRSFEDAIIMMEYMPYRACEDILKALKSVSGSDMSLFKYLCHYSKYFRGLQLSRA